MSLNDALKKSIGEVKQLDVDYGKEPRIDVEKGAAPITGASPFFWANQILVALPETPVVARVASNDPSDETEPDAQGSPDTVSVPLPGDTAEVGSSTKDEEPAPEKPAAKVEVVSEDDEEEEGAVWSIGGKKK